MIAAAECDVAFYLAQALAQEGLSHGRRESNRDASQVMDGRAGAHVGNNGILGFEVASPEGGCGIANGETGDQNSRAGTG
jgi:hypothetical protein